MPPETITLTKAQFDRLHAEIDYWKGCADRRRIAVQCANARADKLARERNEAQKQLAELRGKRAAA